MNQYNLNKLKDRLREVIENIEKELNVNVNKIKVIHNDNGIYDIKLNIKR